MKWNSESPWNHSHFKGESHESYVIKGINSKLVKVLSRKFIKPCERHSESSKWWLSQTQVWDKLMTSQR